MFLYEPTSIHLSDVSEVKTHQVPILNENYSAFLNATQLNIKPLTDTDSSIHASVSHYSLINMTRETMATDMASTVMDSVKTANIPHHQIMLLILLAIFTTISISISLAVIVFCRKKNTVFMLQKCEQESDVEMDDLPTEIENSDTDTEEVRTAHRVKRSESYPGLSKYSSRSKVESHSLVTERGKIHSSSLIPLLRKTDHINGAIISDKRNDGINVKTSKHLPKSKTFSTQQECLNLLEKPRPLLSNDCNFGSISSKSHSRTSKRKYITILSECDIFLKTTTPAATCSNNLRSGVVDVTEDPKESDKDIAFAHDDSNCDFHGKLEML